MIRISKSKYSEIILEIPTQDMDAIKPKLTSLLQGSDSFETHCIYDVSIFKGDAKFIEEKLIISTADDESISKMNRHLLLNIDSLSIELILSFLEKADKGEDFMPEICDFSVGGKKKEMTLILAIK